MFSKFYEVPKGYFQILNEIIDNVCEHKAYTDKNGYRYADGKTSIIRTCDSCGSTKKFSSYKK